MRLRYKTLTLGIAIAAAFFYGRYDRTPPAAKTPAAVLPSNDVEQIHVDPSTHRLTVVTRKGSQRMTLPDRASTIDVRKDGTVKVTAPQMGFETRPFVGLGYGQGTRLYLGADLAYWKRLDVGLGIGTPNFLDRSSQKFNDFRLGAFISFNFWSNMRATVGYDTQNNAHVLLSVRL